LSLPVAAAPSGTTDKTTEPTVITTDNETSVSAPSSPVSSPVSFDAEDTTQPSAELGDNGIAET
jgi:hypothetical protein